MRIFLIMLALTLLSSWSGLALAHGDYGPGVIWGANGSMMDCGFMGGMRIIPILFCLLGLVILVLAIMALVKYLRQ